MPWGDDRPYAHTVGLLGNHGYPWEGYDAAEHDPVFEWRNREGTPGKLSYGVVSR